MRWRITAYLGMSFIVCGLLVGSGCVSLPDELMLDWEAQKVQLAQAREELTGLKVQQAEQESIHAAQVEELQDKMRLTNEANAERSERLTEKIRENEALLEESSNQEDIDALKEEISELNAEKQTLAKNLSRQDLEMQRLLERQEQNRGAMGARIAASIDTQKRIIDRVQEIQVQAVDYAENFDEMVAAALKKAGNVLQDGLGATGYGGAGFAGALILNGIASYFMRRQHAPA